MTDAIPNVLRPADIDAFDGGLPDDGYSESDYGLIEKQLAAKIMQYQACEWAVVLSKKEGNGNEEDQKEEEQEKQEEQEENERMELEELIEMARHMGINMYNLGSC